MIDNSLSTINIAVIGNDSVGKRSIIYRYMYPKNYKPKEKNHFFKYRHENTFYQVKIYEQALLSKMVRTKHCVRGDPKIDIVFVVYDITDKKSFKDIAFEWNNLIQDILFFSHGGSGGHSWEVPFLLPAFLQIPPPDCSRAAAVSPDEAAPERAPPDFFSGSAFPHRKTPREHKIQRIPAVHDI